MLSTAAFLQQMQEIFGEGLCWDNSRGHVCIYEARIGAMVGVDTVVGDAKLVLASAVSEEMRARERKCILCVREGGIYFRVCGNGIPLGEIGVIPPISWVFCNDTRGPYEFDLQLWIAKELAHLELFDDDNRCILARRILVRVYEEASYCEGVIDHMDANMANYLLREWAPQQITVTHEEIRRALADLSRRMQTLQDLESILYSP